MAQDALGQVVGQRQVRVLQHAEDCIPVIEKFLILTDSVVSGFSFSE